VIERASHLFEEGVGHLAGEAVADEDALYDEVFAVGRHGVSGNEPAAFAEAIGEVVEGEVGGCGVFEFPAEAGCAVGRRR